MFSILLSCCTVLYADCQQQYWQQQVNFTIAVTLNDESHTLDGIEKMEYINHSPDTLRFIWIHLWPNAFKNDRTAFSDQTLENGSADFYFSNYEQRGYINQLDFKVNGSTAAVTAHPKHQDIVQLMLPQPLPPGSTALITTPFHVKLPQNFSRGGHTDQAYQITQWYPKPAVYDHKGWHPMPYLDQGEFYSEFGNYEVSITLPANYRVAATGLEVNPPEIPASLITKSIPPQKKTPQKPGAVKKKDNSFPPSDARSVTHTYRQENVHDFAWFADKRFQLLTDTLQLPSGRIIKAYSYFLPGKKTVWNNSLTYIKKTIRTRSQWMGEYPYNTVTAVEAPLAFAGGMEYPTITAIAPTDSEQALEELLEHEVGHNWNYGILASNERAHPWMDEGINTYYDNRYKDLNKQALLNTGKKKKEGFAGHIPDDMEDVLFRTLVQNGTDQPIATSSADFTASNYIMMSYYKAGQWMKQLEHELGTPLFDSCMQTFYRRWQFKHPYPDDLKKTIEEVSGRNMDAHFTLLDKKGLLQKEKKKSVRLTTLLNLRNTDKYHYIGIAPATGYNFYDKVMLGAVIHNYSLPLNRFQFLAMPMYATGSKSINGLARFSYTAPVGNKGNKMQLALSGMSFNGDEFTDSTNTKNYLRFTRVVPSVKLTFGKKNPRSTLLKYLLARTFLISETGLRFRRDTVRQIDIISYPVESRYVNQVQLVLENSRTLYPWRGALQLEQGEGFLRVAFTGNYYFNYAKGGGLDVRLFAGKFMYLGDKTFAKQFQTDRYHLNMTGANGAEDYTYSNYFAGRNEFMGFSSQQLMMRDGAFKVRSDLLSQKIGKTDNWLAAANFVTTIPAAINPLEILPFKIPLRAFVDIGTYAEAWQKNATSGRFLYDAGLQLSLFRNVLNIYVPLLYSKVYSDYFKSTITEKRFAKNIAFSIDIQQLSFRKLAGKNIF